MSFLSDFNQNCRLNQINSNKKNIAFMQKKKKMTEKPKQSNNNKSLRIFIPWEIVERFLARHWPQLARRWLVAKEITNCIWEPYSRYKWPLTSAHKSFLIISGRLSWKLSNNVFCLQCVSILWFPQYCPETYRTGCVNRKKNGSFSA